jgi:hypothetical protein
MGEAKSHNLGEIEGLLATRQQLLGWLDRLHEVGSRAPAQVRSKVEGDYRARLAQVVAQLSTHGDLIQSALEGLRAEAREYRQQRHEEREVRAEAELRHSVGEYTDDEWQLVELESASKITDLDQVLERLGAEIKRLEEVQALITTQPEPASATPSFEDGDSPVESEATGPTLTLVRDQEVELPKAPEPRPEAPRFVPRGGSAVAKQRETPARATPVPAAPTASGSDELAFLRSVTLDPNTTRLTPQAAPGAAGLEREERPSQAAARTLKCGECGSLNRPTEWYCERCGAELAAV